MQRPGYPRVAGITTGLLILLGHTGVFLSLYSTLGPPFVLTAAAGSTAIHLASRQRIPGRGWAVLRWAGRALMLLVAGFMAYLAVALGSLLAWSFAPWVWATLALLAAASVATTVRPWLGLRIPLVLPVGGWIAACLLGWVQNEHGVRCNDIARLSAQPGVSLMVPSLAPGVACAPGAHVIPPGHPRKLYATRDTGRWLASANLSQAPNVPGAFTGGACVLMLDAEASPPRTECAYPGMYHLAYRPDRDEVFGVGFGGIIRSTATSPLRPLAAVPPDPSVPPPIAVQYFSTLDSNRIDVFYDDFQTREQRRGDDLTVVERTRFLVGPEEVRFDPERREGVHCFASTPLLTLDGKGFLALAWKDDPTRIRLLGSSDELPWAFLAFSDGCDFDPGRRRVYVGVATLGLIAVLDYDTGRLADLFWGGFGLRAMTLDTRRQRLYASSFLPGEVRELDAHTGTLMRRWFVGRFVRDVELAEEETALYTTSTMGVARIQLTP